MSDEHTRRYDDRDRMLSDRLDNMERDHQQLTRQVTSLESKLNIVQLEQVHLKDLFDARLKVIEKAMEMQLAETKLIATNIQAMGDSPSGTPMGRQVQGEINQIRATLDEQGDVIKIHQEWQTRVNGVLAILKWIGAGGLVALGITLLRLFKVLP